MKNLIRAFLGALAIAMFFAVPGAGAQDGSRVWKGSQKVLPMDENAPPPMMGKETTTPSGLRYWEIREGTGGTAVKGKIVKIHYRGWGQNGKEFINSVKLGQPAIFRLGAGQVIQGWDDGIEGMRVGGTRELLVPSTLAYGDTGLPPSIPPNSTLIYTIELLGVQ